MDYSSALQLRISQCADGHVEQQNEGEFYLGTQQSVYWVTVQLSDKELYYLQVTIYSCNVYWTLSMFTFVINHILEREVPAHFIHHLLISFTT